MNIFVLDQNPYEAARQHCDKHVVKMVLEYGQMLSTAHRMRDGRYIEWLVTHPDTGRQKYVQHYLLEGEGAYPGFVNRGKPNGSEWSKWRWEVVVENQVLYKVAHPNHPCSMWVRENDANYHWLFMLFEGLLREYTHRYGKVHSAAKLLEMLRMAPMQIPRGVMTPFVQAMPDEYKHEDAIEAYHRFYVGSKARFARWTNRDLPKWFERALEGQDVSIFKRTRTVD